MNTNEKITNSYLQRISNILLINGSFLDSLGLYSGETGLALFFFRYARFTHKDLYSDYSFDLIEKTQKGLHQETPINYKQGLTGIGSAIEYLVQNGYFEVDTDYILEDLDKRIFTIDSLPYLQIDDLLGICYYALWRITGNSVRKDYILKTVLPQIVRFMESKCQNNQFSYPTVDVFKEIIEIENRMMLKDFRAIPMSLQACRSKYPYGLEENTYNRFLERMSNNDFIIERNIDLGLQNGLAGFGMALMTQLDGDDSWISLLPDDLIQQKDEPLPL